jgi:hypothetical protein
LRDLAMHATAMLTPLLQAKESVGAFLLTATYAGTLTDQLVTGATAKPFGASKSRGVIVHVSHGAGNERS